MIELREITEGEAQIESEWAKQMPIWWQKVDKSVSSFTTGPRTRIGVFENEEMVAIYTLQEVGPQMIDAHLSCRRGVSVNTLYEAAMTLKNKLLETHRIIYLWPLRWNFALIRLAKACGFQETGIRMLQGQMNGRSAEWIQLGATNVQS